MSTTHPAHPRREPRKLFATFTDIRQTGIQREWDGTTTYSFLATVSRDDPPVVIILTITPALVLRVQAHFGTTRKEGGREGDDPV